MEKKFILPKNSDYKRVTCKNKSYGNKHLILYRKKNGFDYSRFGITITKKVGNSVKRNKIRRRLKEILRDLYAGIEPGYDYVFIVKIQASDISFDELRKTTVHILGKVVR